MLSMHKNRTSARDWQLMGFHEYINAKSIMQLNGSIESIYGQAQTRSKNDASANRLIHLYHCPPLFCNVHLLSLSLGQNESQH